MASRLDHRPSGHTILFDVAHMYARYRRRSGAGFGCWRSENWIKLDFLFAGAMAGRRTRDIDGLAAYRDGLAIIRQAAGPGTFLVGCGAPILASIGAGLDAIRTTPDVAATWEPAGADLSQPSGRSAVQTGRARAFLHPHLLRADPDALMAGPAVEHREQIAAHVAAQPGSLRLSGDRLPDLDAWGLATTRRILHGD